MSFEEEIVQIGLNTKGETDNHSQCRKGNPMGFKKGGSIRDFISSILLGTHTLFV